MSSVDQLLSAVAADVESGRLPACQVAVGRDGDVVVFESFGDATADSRFCVFSATKPIVAAAVWHLLADGRLSLGQRVAELIDGFSAPGKNAVTVEQVLLHTAGFPNAPMSPEEGATSEGRARRFDTWRLEWEPGTRFEYHATSAHWVLVDLLERVEGRDFREVIEQQVCRPLGLPRVLGLEADDRADIMPLEVRGSGPMTDGMARLADDDWIGAGVPGGGGIMTAADLARFYQGVLHNPGGLWGRDVWEDATSRIRCTFTEPLFEVPVNRTVGLVVAGEDGRHFLRYAGFGPSCSPSSYGHAGAYMQIGWADPATGISFAYCHNGLYEDMTTDGVRGVRLAELAATLEL